MENFGKLSFTLLSLFLMTILRGYVLAKLYAWFIVKIYGVAPISIVQAIGLSTITGYLFYHLSNKPKDEKTLMEKLAEDIVTGIVMALFVLAIGWLTKLAM